MMGYMDSVQTWKHCEIQFQRSLCLKKELFAAEIISEGGKEYLAEVACSSSGTHY
jgi:hypothetical protein